MKKTVAAVAILLLAALGGLGYMLFGMEEDPFGPEAVAVNQPQLGVKSQPKTDADVLEALDYEISQNRDTIGWLKIPGSKINNSVLQSHDNAYYLRQDERRKHSLYGCYFADYECSFGARDDLSPNTIIYGHSDLTNNPDGPRFSELFRFTEEDFARSTPVITFATGGSPEAIDASCGKVVPKGDVDALLVAILDMEESPVLKESCILKSRQYDKEERFREYIKLYEDILEADKQG